MEDENKTEVSETAEDQAPSGETGAIEATTTDKAGEETATEDHGKEEDTVTSEETAPVTESEVTPGEDENVDIVKDENVDHDLNTDDNVVDHALRTDDDNNVGDENNSADDNNVGDNSNDDNVGNENIVQDLTPDENVVEDGNVNAVNGDIVNGDIDGNVEGGDVEGKTSTGDQPPDEPNGEDLPEEGENGEAKSENGEQPTEEEAGEVSTEDKVTDGEETLVTDQITEEPGESGEKSEEGVPEKDDGELQAVPEGDESSADQEVSDETPKSPIPQSDTFTEGDRQESPVPQPVGEKLSRGPTPTIEDISREETETELLVPGTPDRQGSVTEGDVTQEAQDEDESSPEPQFDRDFLIEKYNAALAEREQVKQQNYQLQHKLAEYFRKKKSDDRADYDKNVTDQEQRYLKYMDQLQELQKQAKREKENYKLQINDLEDKCKERKKKVDEERNKFTDFKQVVALNSMNSRSGKPISPKDIEQYLINEEKKETEVVNVRLENIKSKNKLKKKEQQLKSKEELAEGLHLIDFEQLKIENQTYNEKIEERNEELLKLRKKITSTVQVLTHLKEKLQFVQAENQVQKKNLQDVEALVGQKRDILSRTKQARDSLRIDNHKLRQNCGLLGNEPLLRDFEERKDEGDDLKIQLEELRLLHAELALNCNQVRRKIEQARMGQAL